MLSGESNEEYYPEEACRVHIVTKRYKSRYENDSEVVSGAGGGDQECSFEKALTTIVRRRDSEYCFEEAF